MNLNFETDGLNFNNKGKPDEIATPQNICDDMSNLFDFKDCNRKIWADIYCKTGNTLESLKKQGVNKENIIAICDNKQSQMLACRELYGKLYEEIDCSTEINTITRRGQVYYIHKYKDIVKNNLEKYIVDIFRVIKEQYMLEFTPQDDFKINNIIMNPPYNPSDLYIDFVTLAHKIASDNVVAITPAKGINGKSDKKNDEFRQNIVPYIEKAVYYIDSTDIFTIQEWGGIVYYLFNKNRHDEKHIKSVCNKNNIINCDYEVHSERELLLFNNTIVNLLHKLNKHNKLNGLNFSRFEYTEEQEYGHEKAVTASDVKLMQGKKQIGYLSLQELKTTNDIDKYKCITSCMWGNNNVKFNDNGKGKIVGTTNIEIIGPNEVPKGSFIILRKFDTLQEAQSFVSFAYSKLVSFLIYFGITGATLNETFWRFVPDPGKFDHIFTDEELYSEYDLTDEEIAIIESVIKERK